MDARSELLEYIRKVKSGKIQDPAKSQEEASKEASPAGSSPERAEEGENVEAGQKTSESSLKAHEPESTAVGVMKATQAKLEEEMRKRRERMEAWRAARKKEAEGDGGDKEGEEEEEGEGESEEADEQKGWTLEDDDDDDDDDDNGDNGGGDEMDTSAPVDGEGSKKIERPAEKVKEVEKEEENVDPLDAFMKGVDEEVKKIKEEDRKKTGNSTATVTVPSGDTQVISVTRTTQPNDAGQDSEQKGELLHNDQDLMEYSDEEVDEGFSNVLARLVKKHKKKDVPKVDHAKVEYESFRKDFYVEVPELARMTEEEVQQLRESMEDVQVKGKGCPKPVKTWAQCGLSTKILDIMKRCGYEKPTPIQAQAIPGIMSGRDLVGIAKTGSGKTLAFVLPMLRHVVDQPPLEPADGPIALIMTPTRELALQIYNECKRFCKALYLRVVCIYGGTGISEQIADLRRGAEIIVCTPGRMIDMLAVNSGRVTNLRRVTYLVLDEADRMFDMGFEPQVTKIVQNIRPDRQTVMFSATFPRQMEALARKIIQRPLEITIGGRSIVCRDVEQHIIVIEEHNKFLKLLELLGIYQEKGSVLVFVEKQATADALFRDLLKHGYPCLSLHGAMDQFDRDSTITDFKNGVTRLLVATSVAARGLDVKKLILVVNFDCPNHYEDYVHRCGRTGRAGNQGYSYTFICPEQEKMAGELINGLKLSEEPVPAELQEVWDKYTERLKQEGKEKKMRKQRLAIGFHGKGYKFTEEEAAQKTEKRLQQKASMGIDEDDASDELSLLTIDKVLERAFSSQPRRKDPSLLQIPEAKPKELPNPKSAAGKALAKASAIADKIAQSKNLGNEAGQLDAAQTAASDIMKGGSVALKGAALASQIAAGINARVGAGSASNSDVILPAGVQVQGQQNGKDEEVYDKGIRYMDEVEINDFPQQVRWRLTNRDNLDTIAELSEAGIAVRGIYVAEGRKPKEGEKKLHLALEAGGERPIQVAKQELKRLVMEEITRMAASNGPQQKPGRYTVV